MSDAEQLGTSSVAQVSLTQAQWPTLALLAIADAPSIFVWMHIIRLYQDN